MQCDSEPHQLKINERHGYPPHTVRLYRLQSISTTSQTPPGRTTTDDDVDYWFKWGMGMEGSTVIICVDLFGLMGPIIGMSPDKKTEIPGMQEERTGLRGVCGVGTLPEAECASSPLATSVDRASEIYGWILEHFPYFSNAPTGWKNSVRHNLSLNKCFRKVDKSLGKANGKGSLWCVDPEYRPNLIQALKKQHFPAAHAFCTPPASPPSASSPPRHLFLQGCSFKESDIDAATAMMLLNSAPGHHVDPCNSDGPLDLSRPDSVLVSSDPKQDHNYSSAALQRCSSRSSSSSLSSLDEGGCERSQSRRAGSEGFHSDEDSDLWDERAVQQTSRRPPAIKWPISKRPRREVKPELDEELKEAAGSLLHLAGIRSCTEGSKRTVKSTKLNRK
ncbi:hypothetical protein CCH79_00001524 [Gambusia affinis]|uniref:Fork-head domain-containing protein n=1 Tax=Gambusia affinis TaxID=33528 RepID=A0A315W2A1_GAMAF|nr:hypothetical protein CCH79_00001524 [Gambusia affinis]